MKLIFTYIIICIVLILQIGCASLTQEVEFLRGDIDSLTTEITSLKKEVIEREEKQDEILRLIRADQQVQFDQIERSINALAGNVSESQERLSKIDRKTHEINRKWEAKARSDSLLRVSKSVEIESLFEIALGDFNAGRYQMALKGMHEVVERYPNSLKAEEALYWTAECSYVLRNYNNAEDIYKQYIKKYNNGKKICVALYKLGLVYEKMKRRKAKLTVWEKLIKYCPNSEEASVAKSRM